MTTKNWPLSFIVVRVLKARASAGVSYNKVRWDKVILLLVATSWILRLCTLSHRDNTWRGWCRNQLHHRQQRCEDQNNEILGLRRCIICESWGQNILSRQYLLSYCLLTMLSLAPVSELRRTSLKTHLCEVFSNNRWWCERWESEFYRPIFQRNESIMRFEVRQ